MRLIRAISHLWRLRFLRCALCCDIGASKAAAPDLSAARGRKPTSASAYLGGIWRVGGESPRQSAQFVPNSSNFQGPPVHADGLLPLSEINKERCSAGYVLPQTERLEAPSRCGY
jgi:hypothetical protein